MIVCENKRILVVDDIRAIATCMTGILQAEGFEVEMASDGEECLARLDEFRPHLIILDLLMPKMHGIDVLKQLREKPEHAGVGVIIHSTKEFTTEFRVAKELGAYGVIHKPVKRGELLDAVHRFFENKPAAKSISAAVPTAASVPPYDPVLENINGVLRFWGTRGSFPLSGASSIRHGGNTTCMQFESDAGVVIFDAGSGIRALGNRLAASDPGHIHLFITHTHWDHIQGFPSFTPIYNPDSKITIYGDKGFGESLESLVTGQMKSSYFPVNWDEIRADIRFEYLGDDPVTIGDAVMTREFTNHPGATIAYKIAYREKTTVFMPDNEFLQGYFGPPDKAQLINDLLLPYEKIIDFIDGADVLVHEAQFMNSEYRDRVGWGHSSVSNACILANLARVNQWIITHHEPAHDDDCLDEKLAITKRMLGHLGCPSRVVHAYDGMAEWL